MSRFGRPRASAVSMKRRPNEPVPPVTRIVLSSISRWVGAKRPTAGSRGRKGAALFRLDVKRPLTALWEPCLMRRRQLLALALALPAVVAARGVAQAADRNDKKKSGGATYIPIDTLTGATFRSDGRRGV